ncbi:hypothetical protein PRIPAC_92212, partial [Pristionchus pacificus]|uniref:Uncharacterized protein n=1 Tax=Pristionchus pacificus TaxID=54126 RepID=A0A2A6BIC7_PRIPA
NNDHIVPNDMDTVSPSGIPSAAEIAAPNEKNNATIVESVIKKEVSEDEVADASKSAVEKENTEPISGRVKKKRKVSATSGNKEKEKSVDSGSSNANDDNDVPLKRRLRDRPKANEKDVRKSVEKKQDDEVDGGKKWSKKGKFDKAEKEMFAYMDAVCEELGVAEPIPAARMEEEENEDDGTDMEDNEEPEEEVG